jgi:hypothetical protein
MGATPIAAAPKKSHGVKGLSSVGSKSDRALSYCPIRFGDVQEWRFEGSLTPHGLWGTRPRGVLGGIFAIVPQPSSRSLALMKER